jgi:1-acyl-sn-glycerol-3-phosphate acyltransferase
MSRRLVNCMVAPPWLYWVLWRLSDWLLWLATGWRVEGRERVPKSGALLVVANHLNNADPYLLSAAVPRQICYLAKVELFNVPILGWAIRQFGAFPIERGGADRQAIKQALELLAADCVVGVFPEGTRSRRAAMNRGLTGVGLLATRSGATILPVAIAGSERLWPPWPRPTLRITIGHPFRLDPAMLAKRDHQAIVDRIMGEIAALAPPAYRGVYAEARTEDG